ncbi:hypothetical protein Pan153_59550 [Gimesia panareensis]|uniref:Uncharacterized protein n=1 Tax=Gimesia panareensis TaxID=2527978 RepID=A0A518FY19_9PLAN|nr:hypothetical protein [Gimesia panareensis]QDV21267.1 hypothetical protein Pan153_59550 [Gimesia panareensis]
MTILENVFHESFKQAVIDCAKEKSEYARKSRIDKAANDVQTFVQTYEEQDFYGEWSQLIVALGKILKDEKWDRHLETIESDLTGKIQKDAFKYAVQIFQAAVSGDEDTVLARLKYLSQAVTTGDENEKEVMGKICAVVNEALRRDIMIKLREKEYSPSQNQVQSSSNVQNAERAHPISGDFLAAELSDGQITTKPEKKKHRGRPKKDQQQKWLGDALLILKENPGWSDIKIAGIVGVHSSTLGRNEIWKDARKVNINSGPLKGRVIEGRNGSPHVDGEYYDHSNY